MNAATVKPRPAAVDTTRRRPCPAVAWYILFLWLACSPSLSCAVASAARATVAFVSVHQPTSSSKLMALSWFVSMTSRAARSSLSVSSVGGCSAAKSATTSSGSRAPLMLTLASANTLRSSSSDAIDAAACWRDRRAHTPVMRYRTPTAMLKQPAAMLSISVQPSVLGSHNANDSTPTPMRKHPRPELRERKAKYLWTYCVHAALAISREMNTPPNRQR
mmetsp:Transcript_45034/g.88127  ORF Transcript_45034/g.88127 Transcript_45034/m.88127 type:complete len:219 (-) Transcript_45034:1105-1761(-)